MSANIWWKCLGDANSLVNASGVPQKRGSVMAQFSRFVHPGFNRIGVTNNVNSTPVSAYKDTSSLRFAIVGINTNTNTSIIQTFQLTNFTAASVTPWITSETLSLAGQSDVAVSNGVFTYTLPPLSVVTFVGQMATNTPPVLAAAANQTINAGTFLIVTNTASDTNQPAQALTFALLFAPTNAALAPLNNTNAVFTGLPLFDPDFNNFQRFGFSRWRVCKGCLTRRRSKGVVVETCPVSTGGVLCTIMSHHVSQTFIPS